MNKILNKHTLLHLESNLIEKLSQNSLFQNKQVRNSPRAVGDTVQDAIGEILVDCFPEGLIDEFNSNFTRRSMEDVAFFDIDGNYYAIDIKTHNKSTKFNMPNLISVERLARFYRDEKRFFVILLVEYTVENDILTFTGIQFIPIEHLDWDCLTIGALGWGQIQIANSNIVKINREITRANWMLSLCDELDVFYPKEISKITERMEYFRAVRDYWESKQTQKNTTT